MMIVILEGMLWVFRFFMGACVFSFFNVVICRLPAGESVVSGRSHCPGCGRILTARELVPCLSYLLQRGKCLGCGMRIGRQYVWMECLGGAAFVCCCTFYGCGESGVISLKGMLAFAYLGILTVVAGIDWNTKVIYDRFHIGIVLLGIASMPLYPEWTLSERILGAFVVAVPMLVLALFVEGAFGGGDIKLMASSGFFLGWRAILVAMFLGLVTGGIYCIWMLFRRKLNRKDSFAFGPFLAVGLAIACFYGEELWEWYLSLCAL